MIKLKNNSWSCKAQLTPKVEGVDMTPDFTFQQNETDAVFPRALAREHNYFVGSWARPDFGRRSSEGCLVELDYKYDIDLME